MYIASDVPQIYDANWLQEELRKLQEVLAAVNETWIILSPQKREPSPKKAGMVVNADGINWNPGAGAGLYEWLNSEWRKL